MARVSRERRGYRLVRPVEPAGPEGFVSDPEQAAAVAHVDGPLLVVGGPGTGKTTTLVSAVTARVVGGVDPQRLLVLTFGRRIAGDLRRRIERRLTEAAGTVPEPLVRTFHAYAFGLLRRAAASRGEPPPRLLTGPEQDTVIRELLAGDEARWPERMRAALPTREFARQLRDLLLRAAERGIDAATLAAYGEKAGRDDWRAAAEFRAEYEAVLALRDATSRASVGYDYAELVAAAVRLLQADPELLAAERARLRAVYVDEYADTDPVQRELLALVAGGGAPLVVFADPDSAIYGFRGGDPAGVRTFPDDFPTPAGAPAPVLTLRHGHRGGAAVGAAAARVATRLRGPARHRSVTAAAGRPPGSVEVRLFRSPATEHSWLAHRLREIHLREQVPWSAMAVVVRAGGQLARARRALRAADVPVVTHAEDLPLPSQPAVAPLLRLLRCALDPARLDEAAAVSLLHSPLGGADPFTERRLRQGLRALARSAGDQRPSGMLLVEALREPAELAMVDRRWAAPAKAVSGLLATAREAAAVPGATAEAVLWAVWRASGLAERWQAVATGHRGGAEAIGEGRGEGRGEAARAAAADRDLDAIVVLFDAAARFADRLPGARIEVFLDYLQGQELPADTLAPSADRGEAVRLLTAHAAKSLEWEVVALPGVQEGVWPDLRLRGSLLGAERLVDLHAGREVGTAGQSSALLAEERRLFHVAVTRARRTVLASAVAADSVGGDELAQEPSRFLRELAPDALPLDEQDDAGAPAVAGVAAGELSRGLGLTLPGVVAELRGVVADPGQSAARRQAAAAQLARLARAGVPGADPDQWWGLAALSDDRPLAGDGDVIRVSPSAIESALRCSLRWLLEKHGGGEPPSAAQGVGNLVHATAMLADRATVDRAELVAWLGARFDAIEHAARWLAGPERDRAEQMIDKLVRWVAGNPRRLLAIEQEFTVRLDNVELNGRVDRLELDPAGRLVVVDLKTGKQAPAGPEIEQHPQLGAYQAAVAAGGFAEHGDEPGGATLVQLGTGTKDAREQAQSGLADAGDPEWAGALVRRTGAVMAGSTFTAVRNNRCRTCPVRTSCPISGQGRQVVQP
ncbi:ATP-dependent helicase [Natronosporangium hydrolyticum]|uniref:DNA 3'-5' helicase n=1 Tax=Natronosporangium hydrolyticum TaxID=2811111 RepID=A0A895YNX5_9ACTN|nr:ATP-dependent DNA helicase [Natronosporangium hydrolyticum]QSB15648.1 ATP-dependent helicase [Natronosporangium hydrolyticum]